MLLYVFDDQGFSPSLYANIPASPMSFAFVQCGRGQVVYGFYP